MRNSTVARRLALFSALIVLASACKSQRTTPEVTSTTPIQPRMETMTVTGCLRSGWVAPNTWVLTESAANGAILQPATYQLLGGDEGTLRASVGQLMEVSGT